jgi:uncharacterized protein (TIGR02246 family)
MNIRSILAVSLVCVSLSSTAQTANDSATIQSILKEEVESWNKGDAIVYSQRFADNGTFTNIRGMFFTGHKEFLDRHVEVFKGMFLHTTLQQKVVSFRFVAPDVAIVETLTWISGFPKDRTPMAIFIDARGRMHTRLLQVFQKQSGAWKIVVYHNVDLKPDTPVPAHG